MSFRNSEGANHDSLGGFSGISKMGNHDRISKSVGILEVLGTIMETQSSNAVAFMEQNLL